MNQMLETAKPLTDWLYTEEGLPYRWVLLSNEQVTALREEAQRLHENTEPSSYTQDRCTL
jgi:hypothetical protein